MPRCYMSGVEIRLEDGYVLNTGAALRALQTLRGRAATLERLIGELGKWDEIEYYDGKSKAQVKGRQRRLLSSEMGKLLAGLCPETRLFLTWNEWKGKRRRIPSAKEGELAEDKNQEI